MQDLNVGNLNTLLCGHEKYSEFKYNEGIAELMLYILFSKDEKDFQSELKQSESDDKNADIVLEHNGITYSFEV